jgi:hypothetical protein
MRPGILAAIVALFAGFAAGSTLPGEDDSGVQIVRAMHDRYAGSWFYTLTFEQATTQWDSTGREVHATWYESAKLPGNLRIDFGQPKDGNGVLFTADSTFVVHTGTVTRRRAGGNELLAMLFDVYVLPTDQTVSELRRRGYDLAKVHRETWQGQPTYVIGADSGDVTSPQVWVDSSRLVAVRQISPVRPGEQRRLDARFNKYEPAGGGWIAVDCEFYVDGKLIQREQYSNVRANASLSPALFDPATWTTAPHWVR